MGTPWLMESTTATTSSGLVRRSPLCTLASVGTSGDHGKSFGSLNMDDLFNNVYAVEESQVVDAPGISNCRGENVEQSGTGAVESLDRNKATEAWEGTPHDRKMEGAMVFSEMTLEDYLTGVGVWREEDVGMQSKQEMVERSMLEPVGSRDGYVQQQQAGIGSFLGFGNGVEGGGGGRGRMLSPLNEADKMAQQRQKRMIKNRESAARSRERKQACTVELESLVAQLEGENSMLRQQQEEQRRKRLKELIETRIPVAKLKRPQHCLLRTNSI